MNAKRDTHGFMKIEACDIRAGDLLECTDGASRGVTLVRVHGMRVDIECHHHKECYQPSFAVRVKRARSNRKLATANDASDAFRTARTAYEHKLADKRCGREWVCACSACLKVRPIDSGSELSQENCAGMIAGGRYRCGLCSACLAAAHSMAQAEHSTRSSTLAQGELLASAVDMKPIVARNDPWPTDTRTIMLRQQREELSVTRSNKRLQEAALAYAATRASNFGRAFDLLQQAARALVAAELLESLKPRK